MHRKRKEGANGISSTDANVEEVGINDNDGDINNSNNSKSIDIKGAITLSATIISFLIALTLLESGGGIASSASISELQIPCLLGITVVSLTIFVFIERQTESPLVDLKLLKHKSLLPSYLILMSIGITMFLVYPTVVQLVRSPQPIGFGGNAVTARTFNFPS